MKNYNTIGESVFRVFKNTGGQISFMIVIRDRGLFPNLSDQEIQGIWLAMDKAFDDGYKNRILWEQSQQGKHE